MDSTTVQTTAPDESDDARVARCTVRDRRAMMTDADYWQDVAESLGVTAPDDDSPDLDEQLDATPCPECGASGACAYDAEGRALIHATGGDE